PALAAGVAAAAGDPRCLHLHAEPGAAAEVLAAWCESERSRSWVLSREQAIEAGWFGEVAGHVRSRIGDVVVAARKAVAYVEEQPRPVIGQHGSWAPEEQRVPLLRFGAFAAR
ncbi:MAG: alkaline phosphatase family protein, partial [Microbacteriaceae bacterium]